MMQINVLTPDLEIFKGNITSVKVPGVSGRFQVLKNHAPIVSALEEGEIIFSTASNTYEYYDLTDQKVKTGEKEGQFFRFKISGGFIEVLNNQISLLVRGVSLPD